MPGPFAVGVQTQLRMAKESTWNTVPGAGTARLVRRVTCDLATQKAFFKSNEIRPSYMLADGRQGLISSKGTFAGELSPGSHSDMFGSLLRRIFTTGVNSTVLTNVTAAASPPHFVRAAGSFLTDGFKVGDIIRWAGWATTGVPNNARNYFIYALTATNMSVYDLGLSATGALTSTVAAKASGDSVTATVQGKKTFFPQTAQTDESYSFERYYPDTVPVQSEVFSGVKIGKGSIKFTSGAMGTFSMDLMGASYVNAQAAFFTTPTAVSTTPTLASPNGALLLSAAGVGYVTDLQLDIVDGLVSLPVIGSNVIQGVVQGQNQVSGSLSCYFQDATVRDYFLNETEISLIYYSTTSSSLTADFIQVCVPRLKIIGATKPDGMGVVKMACQIQSLENVTGGTGTSSEATTISMQDTLA